ncbi:proton-conducting transporter membrane subunit [Acuticoccus sp. MNP-M23]|uniref:proton-conducting transporter transmembrane domain-containing protein n=1 Tax=Acuticoccus sp. MNP-M23 TaxID=3072793 RepID=UPI002814E449|nr:proton-conducting transporter membrane subunit [Acuticoccus sp. MNP-M23]WMS43951.1 proton-conducting transporter membrane subunit [Acuticoccus sp. MNP-M23]
MLNILPLAGPLVLLLASFVAFAGPAMRPRRTLITAEYAAIASIAVAAASAVLLVVAGPGTSPRLGGATLSLASRLDAISVIMLLLVSAIGWVVVRFSSTYLDGEHGQGRFTGWLCLTLSAILLFVQAGTLTQLALAWVAASLCLRQLLLFYRQRQGARRAARKEFIVSRLSDIALIGASVILIFRFGTDDIESILSAVSAEPASSGVLAAAGLLAAAALLKSAQFPFHGWLSEVMETPTPVSALLHAGVINAGGFLLIRMAEIMLAAPIALALLVMLGGFTALFGGLVMLTQPAAKTSLAWSTVAQMGFMILQCGLALFPLALLHIVAHSLYKAHALLTAGSAVQNIARIRRPGPIAIPGGRSVLVAFAFALIIYALVAAGFNVVEKSPQAIALGAILIFGVAYLLAQGLADAAPWALTWRTSLYSVGATVAYFTLQRAAEWLTGDALPATPAPGPLEWALLILALFSFGMVALAQALLPLWSNHPAAAPLRIHLANGLYANAITDRMLGSWSHSTLEKRTAG